MSLSETTKKKISLANSGNKNGMWAGKKVGYASLHEWVRKHKPKPIFCEQCNLNLSYEVANISGRYKRDINDFRWLCRGCHMKSDNRIFNLKYQNVTR